MHHFAPKCSAAFKAVATSVLTGCLETCFPDYHSLSQVLWILPAGYRSLRPRPNDSPGKAVTLSKIKVS